MARKLNTPYYVSMPDAERLLRTLHEAAAAFRSTPGRTGGVVSLPEACEVLIGGDLHGSLNNFRALLKKADLDAHAQRHLVLQEIIHSRYFYPLGGDKSHQLLDLTAALKCQYPDRVHYLLGNHELAQWQGQLIAKGDVDYNGVFLEGIQSAYGSKAEAIYDSYLGIFAVANLAMRTANRIFMSHSMPSARHLESFSLADLERDERRPEDLAWGGPVHSLVWGRDTRLATAEAFLASVDADLLITGHIPCEHGFETPNERQIILDSMGPQAGFCLFPTDRILTIEELIGCVGIL
jgi:hypothetical protein